MIRICRSIHIIAAYSLEPTYSSQEVFKRHKLTLPQKHVEEKLSSTGWEHRVIYDKNIKELYTDRYFDTSANHSASNYGARATYQIHNPNITRKITTKFEDLIVSLEVNVEGIGNWLVVELILMPQYDPTLTNNIPDGDLTKIVSLSRAVFERRVELYIQDTTSFRVGTFTYPPNTPINIMHLLQEFGTELHAKLVFTAGQTPHLKILHQFECELEADEESKAFEKMESFYIRNTGGRKTRKNSQDAPWLEDIKFSDATPRFIENSIDRWLFISGRTQSVFVVNYVNRDIGTSTNLDQLCARRMLKMQHVEQIVLRRLGEYLEQDIERFREALDSLRNLQGEQRVQRCNLILKELRVYEDAFKDIKLFVGEPDDMTDVEGFVKVLDLLFEAENTPDWIEKNVAVMLESWRQEFDRSLCNKV